MSFFALTVGALLVMNDGIKPSALIPGQDKTEVAIIPTEQNAYVTRDIRIKLTIPSAFLHQHGETWAPPLTRINFPLSLHDYSPTSSTPIEDPAVVVVTLMVVSYDAVDAGYNRENPRFSPILEDLWGREISRKFELNYVTNIQYPGGAPHEYLFDDGPFHRTSIYCRPSENSYPSLCTLTQMSERGGGVNPQSNSAIMTEITFRHDRLSEWKAIGQRTQAFLASHLAVMRWES